ncbi:uncharacterized protein [Blastocystis hominis]|uniref:RING-type domain-containing protein n=1 Tax=Blastocystis hominis TaxID=12968 RepID=D8LZN3_BLAHO|nr:uncharacterized protein [Blastocystis hominis]CBK21272.2 unnamed protein product [Blastocystis hominis]|eukprot:XP_012895320.1 uncharacterized protein [Blastocystis hominis]
MSSTSESDDAPCCPLCANELDDTDQSLFPCSCNCQVCLWCLRQLMDSNKPCPNCRKPYNEKNFRRTEVKEKKKKTIHSRVHSDEDSRRSTTTEDTHDLKTVRVIQKNLVYVIGLPNESASESILRRRDMFGQYGKLNKIVFNNRNPVGDRSNTCGVYLTYETNEQALDCINAVDGYIYLHRMLKCVFSSLFTNRASYGTTKYCYTFIRGQKCNNPDCLYLHRLAAPENCFTKEEMAARQADFHAQTHPGPGSYWDDHHQRCVYRRSADESHTSLPPPLHSQTHADADAATRLARAPDRSSAR